MFDPDLLNEAITHRPTVFDRPASEMLRVGKLAGYFLTTADAPPWYLNSDLREDQRSAAAAVYVWLVEWVRPVLDAIAQDADATAVVTKALPRPRLPKKLEKVIVYDRSRLHSDSTWDKEFQTGPVFLWSLWARWDDLVGTKRPVPPAPEYPHLEGLTVDDRERFKALVTTRPVVMLALNGREFTGQAVAALRWLRMTIAQSVQQAQGKKVAGNRRRPPHETKIRPLTNRQIEAMQIVPECKENFAEAGRRMRLDPKTVRQHYLTGLKKLGPTTVRAAQAARQKPKTRPLPEDRRGQADLYKGHGGKIQQGRHIDRRRRSGKRRDQD
jgi:hypothetical protein